MVAVLLSFSRQTAPVIVHPTFLSQLDYGLTRNASVNTGNDGTTVPSV